MIKIALASKEFVNGDTADNLQTILNTMLEAKQKGCRLVCFGEAFLQGFDALKWRYEEDINIALPIGGKEIFALKEQSAKLDIDLLAGYIEREGKNIYSSCLFIEKGKLLHNYRRISKGWKEYSITNGFYKEGNDASAFTYNGLKAGIALCGDLWDFPQRFKNAQDILFWPLYVSYTKQEWENEALLDYAKQAGGVCANVLMINSLSKEPKSLGGAYYFKEGKIEKALDMGGEGLLIIDL